MTRTFREVGRKTSRLSFVIHKLRKHFGARPTVYEVMITEHLLSEHGCTHLVEGDYDLIKRLIEQEETSA